MDLAYLLRVLLKRKWIIILATLIAMIGALGFTFFKKRHYSSSAQYSTGFSADKVRLIEGMVDIYEVDTKFNNVIETFKSPRVIGMLSYRLLLHDLENPQQAYKKLNDRELSSKEYSAINVDKAKSILAAKISQSELLSSNNIDETRLIELLKLYGYDYTNILKFLSINRIARTDYIDVVYKSENPELSAYVVNTLGVEYLRFFESLSLERSQQSFDTIGSMVLQKKSYVDSLYKVYETEQRQQGTLDPKELSSNALQTIREFNAKLGVAREEYNKHKNAVDAYNTQLLNIQTSSAGQTNNSEIIRLKDRRNQLISDNTQRGGNDAALLDQIEQINTEIAKKSTTSGLNIKTKEKIDEVKQKIAEESGGMQAADENIKYYTDQIRKLQPLTNITPGSNVKIEQLKSLLEIETKQYGNMVDKYNQAQSLLKENPNSNFRQTLIGQPAVEPESARKILTTALAGASVFFITILIFVFGEIFDNRIKTASQFTKSVRLPLIATINHLENNARSISNIIIDAPNTAANLTQEKAFKENLRKLRFQIVQTNQQVFLFTSMRAGEGKSTIMQALAQSMLLIKKSVLLIDANFSNNSITRDFNAKPTLTNELPQLNGDTNYNLLAGLISRTEFEGLYVIGCAPGNKTPAEVLPLNSVLHNIHLIKKKYDFIFIEGASLNNHSDTKELLQYTEQILNIISAKSVILDNDRDSIKFFTQLNGQFSGCVLNDVETEDLDV